MALLRPLANAVSTLITLCLVAPRVLGVAVGWRNLIWERIQMPPTYNYAISTLITRGLVASRVLGVAVGGRDLNWERIQMPPTYSYAVLYPHALRVVLSPLGCWEWL